MTKEDIIFLVGLAPMFYLVSKVSAIPTNTEIIRAAVYSGIALAVGLTIHFLF